MSDEERTDLSDSGQTPGEDTSAVQNQGNEEAGSSGKSSTPNDGDENGKEPEAEPTSLDDYGKIDDEDEDEGKKSPLINIMIIVVMLLAIGYLPLHFYLEGRKKAELSQQCKQKAYEYAETTKEPEFARFIVDQKHDIWFEKASKVKPRDKREMVNFTFPWEFYERMMKKGILLELEAANSEFRTQFQQLKKKP